MATFPGKASQTKSITVLITGASSGIGLAAARLFAAEGFRVFGTSRRWHADENGIEMLELDVTNDGSVQRCVEEVLARAEEIDLLVNNAGVLLQGSFAEETAMEDARRVFETNFFGVVRMTNAVLPAMRFRRQGRIINIGSLAAWVGEPGEAFHSASKHALAGYTESLRHEVWPLRLHVSLVEPSVFKTNIFLYQESPTTEGAIADYDCPRRAARQTMRKAAQHGDDPSKVAHIILNIARARSPRLRYVVGRERWVPYAKVLLPQRLFDYAVRRGFGLRANAPDHSSDAAVGH
jgi:NAD(P)-dependent dehydrogenase (short-subunit alcohol dehydrogenase family)